MVVQRFYYALKPFIPWRVRMALRRVSARRKRAASKAIWPINEAAGRTPEDWRGWPEGKKFALVLTHDVEGPDGLEKCRALAELEMEFGLRSSFNFIPEGTYVVPSELRDWLTRNGFEVGVHDLKHDGHLFTSRREFRDKALRINRYLHEWGSTGFRAGFMLRNLNWLHTLDIRYDCSTFDTDPFEFQPKGADTIFPFWIPTPSAPIDTQVPFPLPPDLSIAAARGGYLELPYTLPQDSTLFLVLQEKTADIWTQKLDWIAEHGGMALVNVHPDYIDFTGTGGGKKEYPASLYADFLRHVTLRHDGRYWSPLPRDLTTWDHNINARGLAGSVTPETTETDPDGAAKNPDFRGKRVAVLLYSSYPSDPRPRRAAEALVAQGAEVEVICLRQDPDEATVETVAGVLIRRLPHKHRRGGKLTYVWQYSAFLLATFFILGWRTLRRRYDLVHVHNMPDVLVFSALVPKICGARVLLDLHDPMPELMMTIFGSARARSGIALLKRLEKWSIGFADRVLTVNMACKKIFSARSCAAEKVAVVMNSPDEEIFRYREADAENPAGGGKARPFVIMYHGSIVERHGLDLAVEALGQVRRTIPSAELRIYGNRTPFLDQVLASVKNTALAEAVHYLGPKNLDQIAAAIAECDVGIIPNRRSIFTELNTPTRIFEYLSQARPVIAPLAPGITDYFGPDDLVFFELGNATDLAVKIEHLIRHPKETSETLRRGQEIYCDHRWSNERARFLNGVAELLGAEERLQVEARPAAGAALGKKP